MTIIDKFGYNRYLEGRIIPDYHYGTIEYNDWWGEQKRRCIEGYLDISGEYYYFLNFFKMNRILNNEVVFDLPSYNEKDKETFSLIKSFFKEGKNVLLITARGEGKSYKAASLVSHNYTFFRNSYNIVSGSLSEHTDKLWKKVVDSLDNIISPFYHNRIKDNSGDIISGTIYKDEFNQEKKKGYNSQIEKIIFGDRAGKARGGRPRYVLMEEVGSWTGAAKLIDCYNAVEKSLKRGIIRTGQAILIGTGGEMKTGGSEDAKEMFYNPEAFNLGFVEDEHKKRTALFIPAFAKLEGCYGEDGVNDEKKALDFLNDERKKLYELNITEYEKYIQEFPYTPEEAFLVSDISHFSFMRDRLEYIELRRDYNKLVKRGVLFLTGKKLEDGLPEVAFKEDKRGKIQILEFPRWYSMNKLSIEGEYMGAIPISKNDLIQDLYISGCDSYDQDKAETSNSEGSIFIFKRNYNVDESGNLFVAQYTDRPEEADDFYYNTLLLNLFYRSKMLIEYTKISIINYYKNKNFYNLLWEAPKLTIPDMKYSKASNKVGYLMTDVHKNFAIEKYKKYLKENKEKMYFKDQLKDNIEFNKKLNKFDRTIASMLCIIQNNELNDLLENKSTKSYSLPYWKRDEFGNMVFKS